jgi:hypothetical protein
MMVPSLAKPKQLQFRTAAKSQNVLSGKPCPSTAHFAVYCSQLLLTAAQPAPVAKYKANRGANAAPMTAPKTLAHILEQRKLSCCILSLLARRRSSTMQ